MEQRLLIVKNIPKACTKDTIENYLEVVCDNGVDSVDFYDERATHIALVTFTEPLSDISTLKKNVSKRKLEGEHVELKAVSAPRGVIVTQLPKTLTKDTLQFYFENKKSGGQDDGVDDCTLYINLKCAVVTFNNHEIARNVLAVKSHTPVKTQSPVKLEPFYKGYQDEVIKFLSDLDPPGASGDDDLDSGGDKSPRQDEQPTEETECSIKQKIQQFQNVQIRETSTAVRASQCDYEFVLPKTDQIRSISGRDSQQSKEKITSVNIPRMEDGQAEMSYHVPPKREDQGMVSINIKEKKDEKIYDTIDDDAVEMRNPSKSKRTEQNKPSTAPKPKRSSMNRPSESSEDQDSESVKFNDSANVRLLEKMHLFEDDFPTCSIKYKSSTGEITITGPKSKLFHLKLKMLEDNNRITKDSCHLHQAAIDLISREKGKRLVEDELKEMKESIWFVEGQKCVCLTFSETETRTMIAKVRSLVHHETVPYNESHFKYINGTQWKDLVQKLEQEHLVKILVDRSNKKVKVEGLGKDTAQCRDRVLQEITGHSHKDGEFTAKGAHARCLKGNFDKEIQEVKKIIMDSDAGGSWDETGGQSNLHLKFAGDPKCVKKVEAEMKKLEKKVWHERLHLKEVSKEKHVNLLIRGIHRNKMSGYQAAFESQHSVYLDMNLPGAPKITEAVQEAFQSRPPFKHANSAPVFNEQEEDDDDNDDDNDNEEDDEDADVKELQVFSGFRAQSGFTPPRRSYGPPRRSSPPRQQNTSLTCGNVTLTVSKGDVSKETVDVFVNVVPKSLDLTGTAVSQAYVKAGGPTFQQQFEASKPMWKPGSILQTNCTGNLNGQMVYTFVLEKWNPHRSKKELSSLIDTCLKTADGNGYTSIALTSFGCGRLFKFPEKYVASCLVKAVKANSGGNLQKVSIVIYDHATYQAFLDEIDPPSTLRHSRTMPDLDPFDRYPSNDTITVGPTTISVQQGDITKAKGTVLVNPISEDLKFGVTAVAQALARAAGRKLIQEFEIEKDSPTGNIIVTTGAQLNCQFVYHVILKKSNARGSNDYKSRIRECFKLAAGHNTQSMVFPAIGCGMLFKYPDDVVASTLIEEAKKSNIPNVTFMIYDQQQVKTFLRELGGGNSDEEEEDTSGNFNTLRKFAKDSKSDKVPKADNKSANIVVYGATKDICTKARSNLSKQLKQDFLQEKEITNENLLHFKGKTLSKMKNMADRNGIWIKFPDPDKKKNKDTPTLKLMGEKNAVLLVTAEIQDLLLKEVAKTIPRPRKLQGARGSMKLIDEMAEMSEFLPPAYWKNNQSSNLLKQAFNKLTRAAPPTNGLVAVDTATFNAIDKVIQTTWDATLVGHGKDAVNLHHQNIKVKQIQRLENPDMFRLYSQKRSAMFRFARNHGRAFTPIKSLPGSKYAVRTTQSAPPELQREIYPEVNEHYLFHGTKMENIQAIITHGLDPRVGGKGMFGSGVYGAESSTKADQYTDDKKNRTATDKQMLLMRVTMGQPLVSSTPKDYCRPPCKDLKHLDDKCNQQNHGLFDSVIADGTWNFREFVVYAGDVCYPEYVITYTRV